MIKIDLHTHSSASSDGGIKPQEYISLIENNILDYVAITDHNSIKLAQKLHKTLGNHIIIGEEIMTREGEIIGLYLDARIAPGHGLLDTIQMIKNQGGLVYAPHPFETVRKGIQPGILDAYAENIDIVEVHNARALFQNRGPQAATWAKLHRKPMVASSDAHGVRGVGTTYTQIAEEPTVKNLVRLLKKAHFITNRPPLYTLLYPKIHRMRKKIGQKH